MNQINMNQINMNQIEFNNKIYTLNDNQLEIYNKNCELWNKAWVNRNKYGVLMSFFFDLGINDFFDMEKFINVYPYKQCWY